MSPHKVDTHEHPLLRIGEFAQLGHVSIATLHHYDEYGLLKPAALDPQTGYRYYTYAQLLHLNHILALKDLGFSLEEIAQMLPANLTRAQLREMYQRKQAEIARQIATAGARWRQIAAHLQQLEEEEAVPMYDVLVKNVAPMPVASVRARVPHINERGPLRATLAAYLAQQGVPEVTSELLLLHSRHEMHDGYMSIDLEVAMPLTALLPGNAPIHSRTLPGTLVAYTVHTGVEVALGRAYVALHRWIDANGYQMTGPVRQIPLQRHPQASPSQAVTEVQFPVAPLATTSASHIA